MFHVLLNHVLNAYKLSPASWIRLVSLLLLLFWAQLHHMQCILSTILPTSWY